MDDKKFETSIHYRVAHIELRNYIYSSWNEFSVTLKNGPESMKDFLVKLWNQTREKMSYENDIIVTDMNREVTRDDFTFAFERIADGDTPLFVITFPKPTKTTEAFAIGLALTPKLPCYFTLELDISSINENVSFYTCEWSLDEASKTFNHLNFGKLDELGLDNYIKRIDEIVKQRM